MTSGRPHARNPSYWTSTSEKRELAKIRTAELRREVEAILSEPSVLSPEERAEIREACKPRTRR